MSKESWLRFLRVPAAVGVMVGLIVGVSLYAYASTRPERYQSEFTLVATPRGADADQGQDFSSVVSITLPSLTALVRSAGVLSKVADEVDGVNVSELEGSIGVEIVPASGVARVTLQGSKPGRVTKAAAALSDAVLALDLLRPVGSFRSFDTDPTRVTQVRPDSTLALGLAASAGVLAGLIAGALVVLLDKRLLGPSSGQVTARGDGHSGTQVSPTRES